MTPRGCKPTESSPLTPCQVELTLGGLLSYLEPNNPPIARRVTQTYKALKPVGLLA